ncbi:hypothetical protein [Metabacillus sp. cB07]|uniref:hypothetical protein n=1 Tax=Metabacillus sp. cB07 TaxID=2806989 RepID=UPI001939DAB5|nr:hypothetical protein [Metabacillus sp. cB07]
MFGENEVNDYHLLKYSLLDDFFKYFSSIIIFGVPLSHCLAGQFLLPHLQPFVDSNLSNRNLLAILRKQNRFLEMSDIHQKLGKNANVNTVNLKTNRKAILLSDEYSSFAYEQLREYDVTLYGVISKPLPAEKPPNFKHYYFRNVLMKVNNQVLNKQQRLLGSQIEEALKLLPAHYYLSSQHFRQWLLKAYKGVIKWVYMLDQLILKTKPSVIICPSEASIFGTILGLLAKKYTIPFINMPLLLIGDQPLIPSRADYYFVWGDNQKKFLQSRNISETKIIKTGNVKFYYERKPADLTKEEFMNTWEIPENHKIIGFTTQPFPNTNDQIERWIDSVPKSFPVSFIVKKHRADQHEYSIIQNNENVKFVPADYPLYEFLHHLDALMTISSNTAVEAALLNKPLLILQPNIPYHYKLSHNKLNSHLVHAEAGEIVNDENSLKENLYQLASDPEFTLNLQKKLQVFLSHSLSAFEDSPAIVKSKLQEIISTSSL